MSNSEQPPAGAPGASSSPDLQVSGFRSHATPARSEPSVFDEKDRIVILTPCYDWQMTTIYADAITLCQQYPQARFRLADGSVQLLPVVASVIKLPNDSHIDRARNSILWSFEQTHYTMGLWMDADEPPEPEHIARFWKHLMHGVQIVTGLVALKDIVPTFVCNTLKGEHPDPHTGLFRIKDGGTGAMAFRRDLLDRLRTEWPKLVRAKLAEAINFRPDDAHVDRALAALSKLGYTADLAFKSNANTTAAGRTVHAYFASGITHRDGAPDWLSEDWMLCHRCWQLGIPVYADVNIKIRHLGKILFPPPPEQIVEAALAVTSGQEPPFDKRLAHAARDALKALHHSISDDSISILHPTRRPEQALRIRDLWLSRVSAGAKGRIDYLFAYDAEDEATREAFKMEPAVAVVGNPGGVVKPINEAAKYALGRILIMAADDCEPPQDWDVQIREALAGQLHLPRLLWTSDGYTQQPVCTHPIMTRAMYENPPGSVPQASHLTPHPSGPSGPYFFCPEYPHLFCDTELSHRAMAAGQVIDGRHIVLKHQHPMFTGMKPDQLHEDRNSQEAWRIGSEIFARRNPQAITETRKS